MLYHDLLPLLLQMSSIHWPYVLLTNIKSLFQSSITDVYLNLSANNPVAGAKFFNITVNMFIKHVLNVSIDRSAYMEILQDIMQQ